MPESSLPAFESTFELVQHRANLYHAVWQMERGRYCSQCGHYDPVNLGHDDNCRVAAAKRAVDWLLAALDAATKSREGGKG